MLKINKTCYWTSNDTLKFERHIVKILGTVYTYCSFKVGIAHILHITIFWFTELKIA